MIANKDRMFELLETINHNSDYFDAELRIGIKGQTGLQVGQLFAMSRMYKHWNDWRVRIGVWLIQRTKL